MKRAEKSINFDKKTLIEELISESKSTALYDDAAKRIIDLAVNNVEHWMDNHSVITEYDYREIVSSELQKYNPDLAYIYLNRDKII